MSDYVDNVYDEINSMILGTKRLYNQYVTYRYSLATRLEQVKWSLLPWTFKTYGLKELADLLLNLKLVDGLVFEYQFRKTHQLVTGNEPKPYDYFQKVALALGEMPETKTVFNLKKWDKDTLTKVFMPVVVRDRWYERVEPEKFVYVLIMAMNDASFDDFIDMPVDWLAEIVKGW